MTAATPAIRVVHQSGGRASTLHTLDASGRYAAQSYEQDRDDHGRFGSGSGGTGAGLPKHDTHAQTEGGGRFEKGTAKEGQVTWAHEKAKEQGRPVYMEPNPKHDPANPKAGDGGPFKLSFKPPKGEHHEVKPDGTMIYHPAPAKAPRGAKGAPKGTVLHSRDDETINAEYMRDLAATRPRISFARAIETAVDGAAPTAARLWRAGLNVTDKGDLYFTPNSAKLVMEAYAQRGNPLAWYYEHEDRIPIAQRGGAPMKGVCSAPSSDLAIRDGEGGPELWAQNIAWTDEAKRQIVSGERRQLSPIAAYDEETREIVEILNVSLCAEGATHNGTLLASREGRTGSDMNELMDALMAAIEAGEWEEAENLIQQMEAADGGEAMAKMARMALKAAKPPPAPAPPPKDDTAPPVATKRLAATVAALRAGKGIDVEAFDRAVTDMQDATRRANEAARRSDRQTVLAALSRAREEGLAVDVVDEREHMAAADPSATERFLGSLRRKAKAGILVASRDGVTPTVEAKQGDAKPKTKTTADDDIAPAERIYMEQFNRSEKDPAKHLTPADIIRSRNMHGGKKPVVGVA